MTDISVEEIIITADADNVDPVVVELPDGSQTIEVEVSSTPGADGRTVLNGTVAPTTEGSDGDFYINTATYMMYGPKANGTWPDGFSLVGEGNELPVLRAAILVTDTDMTGGSFTEVDVVWPDGTPAVTLPREFLPGALCAVASGVDGGKIWNITASGPCELVTQCKNGDVVGVFGNNLNAICLAQHSDPREENANTITFIGVNSIYGLQSALEGLQQGDTNLQTDVGNLQTDVGNLQTNVGNLQTDVGNIQTGVGNLETSVQSLNVDNQEQNRELSISKFGLHAFGTKWMKLGSLAGGAENCFRHPALNLPNGYDGGGWDFEAVVMAQTVNEILGDSFFEVLTSRVDEVTFTDQDCPEFAWFVTHTANNPAQYSTLGWFHEYCEVDTPMPVEGGEYADGRMFTDDKWIGTSGNVTRTYSHPSNFEFGQPYHIRDICKFDEDGVWVQELYLRSSNDQTDWTDSDGQNWILICRQEGNRPTSLFHTENPFWIGLNAEKGYWYVQFITFRNGLEGTKLLDVHAEDVDVNGDILDRASGQLWEPQNNATVVDLGAEVETVEQVDAVVDGLRKYLNTTFGFWPIGQNNQNTQSQADAEISTGAGNAYWWLYYFPEPVIIKEIQTYCWTLESGSTLRFGIYADDGNFKPSTLIADYGTVSGASTGYKILTGTTQVQGWVWVCSYQVGGYATVRWNRTTTYTETPMGFDGAAGTGVVRCWRASNVDYSSGLPANAPALTRVTAQGGSGRNQAPTPYIEIGAP